MKNNLTMAFINDYFEDKYQVLDALFYGDNHGVHLYPVEDIPGDLLNVDTLIDVSTELTSAAHVIADSLDVCDDEQQQMRRLKQISGLHHLAAEVTDLAISIAKAQGDNV
jgi:hypothetical protein